MSKSLAHYKRRGMTGLETAIILVAFVISAAAFSFIILNMGFLTAQKSQSVVSSGMNEATSSLQADGDVIAKFDLVANPSDPQMQSCEFYIRLSQGREAIDSSVNKTIITFTNPLVSGVIMSNNLNGASITEAVGDGDTLIEFGERWKVEVNFTEAAAILGNNVYCGAYDKFKVDVRPSQGSVLSLTRLIPPVNTEVLILE